MTRLDQFDYQLPRELIAQEPLNHRADSRLMIVDRVSGEISHHHVRDLPELLRAEDVLVLNNSHVIPARLVGYRSTTGGRWQGLYLRHDPASGVWEVLTKTRGKLRSGETITLQDRDGRDGLLLKVVGRANEGSLIVQPLPELTDGRPASNDVIDLLQTFGRVPLPPYIRDGHMTDADIERYQTVYASEQRADFGSVAAPTAGLHFTKPLLADIARGQTAIEHVTLHVGIGTFRPMEAENIEEHQMHAEWGRIGAKSCDVINDRRTGGGRCVAVGTTSVRVLESAALASGHRTDSASPAVLQPWSGNTELFIKPPYRFGAVDALMTNFHLPKSSLLVLVSAFAGCDLIRHAYQEAIQQEYRFFSYGDAMLLIGDGKRSTQ